MTPALPPLAFLPDIGGGEMMIVLLVVLLLFGGEKMPQLARGIGKAVREFKKAASGVEQEFRRALDEAPDSPPATKPFGPPPRPDPPTRRLEPPPPPGTSPPP